MSSYQFQTENLLKLSGERFSVHYSIFSENEKSAHDKIQDLVVEQTVEFPADLVPDKIKAEGVIGKLENFKTLNAGHYVAHISYAVETAGGELTQFLNVMFGNISIKPGVRIEKFELSPSILKFIKGPRFGIDGIRKLYNIHNCPLICSALKPMGLSANDLAVLAGQFAEGGVDLIKDDHGLANQSFSTFEERVTKCQKAVDQKNPASVYLPNVSASPSQIKKRALLAKQAGCKGLLISPMLTGFAAVQELSEDPEINLPIMAHPAFIGSFITSPQNGFSHYALFGQMMRLLGADISVYPNFGGRFSFSKEECLSIVNGCTDELSDLKSIFPCPGGGMNFHNVPEMLNVYGKDVIYLMGGGLFRHSPDLVANTRELKSLII